MNLFPQQRPVCKVLLASYIPAAGMCTACVMLVIQDVLPCSGENILRNQINSMQVVDIVAAGVG
jgi:hypothetical protein